MERREENMTEIAAKDFQELIKNKKNLLTVFTLRGEYY